MRACVHHLTAVSVDSISTSTARDMGPGLAVTTYLTGNQCSQAGKQLHQLELGGWECHESDVSLVLLFLTLT
jgi:hypothetical protein